MPSILIIDDDEALREAIAAGLAAHGYTVRQARDGNEGIKAFRAAPADLVLTDLIMPDKEGIATVMELRRQVPRPGIIAMSGSARATNYLKLAGLVGATRTLHKPFNLPVLLKAVEEVLAESHADPDQAPRG